MTLRRSMLGMVAPALAGLVILATAGLVSDGLRIHRLSESEREAALAVDASRLIHEAQKERGMSGGFLASHGKKFSAELPKQRAATDAAARALEAAAERDASAELRKTLDAAREQLRGLAAVRARVDGLAMPPKESFAWYSGLVDGWLKVVERTARDGHDGVTVREATSYLAFLKEKEFAGRERATLNNVFAADAFDAETYRRLVGILAAQDAHRAQFRAYAGPEAVARYEAALAPERFADALALRDRALAVGVAGPLGVQPEVWFAAITRKIDAMKEVEDGLSAALLAHLGSELRSAWLSLFGTAAALVVMLAVALAAALRNGRRVIAALGGEPEEVVALAERIAAGDLEVRAGAVLEGSALAAVEAMAAELTRVITDVRTRLGRIARGDLPPSSSEAFPGVFDELRVGLNSSSEAIRRLVADTHRLESAARAGDLSVRADPSAHEGDFARVIAGFDETLDAIVAPVREARSALERLAARDLTARVEGSFEGDHALMQSSINATAGELHGAIAQVAGVVDDVSSAAAKISAASEAVAAGAVEQATVVEGSRTSIAAMAEKTRGVATHADQARALTGETKVVVEQSARTLARTVEVIAEVRRSADASMEIIRDISQIAAQTSFLALNATIEAARAGAAGRGFAVVADEVRALSTRAKEAATKTEELIRLSVTSTAEGEESVRAATDELARAVGAVEQVSGVIAEIATATAAQATDLEHVREVFAGIEAVAQKNAAASEGSAEVARSLSGRSDVLAELVGGFVLEGGRTAHLRARGARASLAQGTGQGEALGAGGAHPRAFAPSGRPAQVLRTR